MKIRILSVLLIVAGIVVLSFPKLSEMYYSNQQEQLVKEWQESFNNIQSVSSQTEETTVEDEQSSSSEVATNKQALSKQDFDANKDMEGILKIDKIDLLLPILHGATQSNMKTTAASIENTGTAGEVGNYAIAGHRNYTFGRNFNRLDELEVGDAIQVDTRDQQYEYIVTEKLVVKPEEVWVLEGNGKDKEITLVTCEPMVDPTHRLIIKGKITEKDAATVASEK
ncbi:class D sortase [Paenibacillus marinisediminis]